MIPFGNETVTLFHRSEGGYARYVLSDCSWRTASSRSAYGNTVQRSDEISCRIPAGGVLPQPGDVLILGDYSSDAQTEIEMTRLLDALWRRGAQAIRVNSVRDNSRNAPLPHYAVTGGH